MLEVVRNRLVFEYFGCQENGRFLDHDQVAHIAQVRFARAAASYSAVIVAQGAAIEMERRESLDGYSIKFYVQHY